MHFPAIAISIFIPAIYFLALAYAGLHLLKATHGGSARGMMLAFLFAAATKLAMVVLAYAFGGDYPGLAWDIANYASAFAALAGSVFAIGACKAVLSRAHVPPG
jgi:hypothetical protein